MEEEAEGGVGAVTAWQASHIHTLCMFVVYVLGKGGKEARCVRRRRTMAQICACGTARAIESQGLILARTDEAVHPTPIGHMHRTVDSVRHAARGHVRAVGWLQGLQRARYCPHFACGSLARRLGPPPMLGALERGRGVVCIPRRVLSSCVQDDD